MRIKLKKNKLWVKNNTTILMISYLYKFIFMSLYALEEVETLIHFVLGYQVFRK